MLIDFFLITSAVPAGVGLRRVADAELGGDAVQLADLGRARLARHRQVLPPVLLPLDPAMKHSACHDLKNLVICWLQTRIKESKFAKSPVRLAPNSPFCLRGRPRPSGTAIEAVTFVHWQIDFRHEKAFSHTPIGPARSLSPRQSAKFARGYRRKWRERGRSFVQK